MIVDNLPTFSDHVSGSIRFGLDGKLYVSIGDNREESTVQDINFLNGKILRYDPDGSIPADNPFPLSPVYALGMRNTFDFRFHPHTGDLWASENGPEVDDEINRIVAGGNYGWPDVTGIVGNPSFIDPLVAISPPTAPTGIAAVGENSVYPEEYHDNLFFLEWNTGKVRRIVLSGADLRELSSLTIAFNGGEGGLLDLVEAADGFIYVSTPSRIYRLVHTSGGIFKKCVNSQAVYPLSEQHGLEAQERR